MPILSKTPPKGFHILADCDTRTHLVAFFDGSAWWVPGSAEPFMATDVALKDGTNPDGRFHFTSSVHLPNPDYAGWKIEDGRFR